MKETMPVMDSSSQPTTYANGKLTPYRTPKLTRYGQVASLTKGGLDLQIFEDPTFSPSGTP
jgi:hypothetical protein